MPTVPRPEESIAVLIGSAHYTDLPPLATVANNVRTLRRLLTDSEVWGLPNSNCISVIDPTTPQELLSPIKEGAKAAASCLIVYFAGHGYRAADGQLCLALRDSDGFEAFTGVPYSWVVGAIKQHRPQTTIIILDCCYSGLAATVMDGGPGSQAMAEELADEVQAATGEGVYVMASAARDRRALAPLDELYTAFTGELVAVLEQGLSGAGPVISVETLFTTAQVRLRAKRRPIPEARSANTANTIGFRNRLGGVNGDCAAPVPAATVDDLPQVRTVRQPDTPASLPYWRSPSQPESTFRIRLHKAANTLYQDAGQRIVEQVARAGVADGRLTVEWVTAEAHLMGAWNDIRHRHRGTAVPQSARIHRATPIDLTGHIDDPLATFDAIPSERLAILGPEGSGTSVVLHLLADQLGRRAAATGGAVPVVLDPSTWDPGVVPLHRWLVAELSRYAAGRLRLDWRMSAADGLVEADLVIPMLDGLDRMSAEHRVRALEQLSASNRPFVLTCRDEAYSTAVLEAGPPIGLAAIILKPLEPSDVANYLRTQTLQAPEAQPRIDEAVQARSEDLRRPRIVRIVASALTGQDCTPAEHLLALELVASDAVLATDPDPVLTSIAAQITDRGGQTLDWWRIRGQTRPLRLATALIAGVLGGIAAVSVAIFDWYYMALLYGLVVFIAAATIASRSCWPEAERTLTSVANAIPFSTVRRPGARPVLMKLLLPRPAIPLGLAVVGPLIGMLAAAPQALASLSPEWSYEYGSPAPSNLDVAAQLLLCLAIGVGLFLAVVATVLRIAEVTWVERRRGSRKGMLSAMRRAAAVRFVAFTPTGMFWGFSATEIYGPNSGGLAWFQGISITLALGFSLGIVPSLWYQTLPSRIGKVGRAFQAAVAEATLRPFGAEYGFLSDRLIVLLADRSQDRTEKSDVVAGSGDEADGRATAE